MCLADGFLDDIGNIVLWTVIECDLGILAGSLPMLRALFKSLAKDYSSNDDYQPYNRTEDNNLVTIGRIKTRGYKRTNDFNHENGTIIVADNDSNQELDSESTRKIITVTRAFETRTDEGRKEIERGVGPTSAYEFEQSGVHHIKR